jgi:hypothetical protein
VRFHPPYKSISLISRYVTLHRISGPFLINDDVSQEEKCGLFSVYLVKINSHRNTWLRFRPNVQ